MRKYVSLFSGVEGAGQGLEKAGFRPAMLCEVDPACRSVLRYRYSGVPLAGDITQLPARYVPDAEVYFFGSPCQDFSIAGKRSGITGERSSLFHEGIRIIRHAATSYPRFRFAVWENVAGVLSSRSGDTWDFSEILNAFSDSGAKDICWRVMDAQYFGVPQRRRRVFLVADYRDECAEEVLFEPESLSGNPSTGTGARQGNTRISGKLSASGGGTTRPAGNANELDFCVPIIAKPLLAKHCSTHRHDMETFVPELTGTVSSKWAKGTGGPAGDECYNLTTAFYHTNRNPDEGCLTGVSPSIKAQDSVSITQGMAVRRFTPRESERLMGWEDDWTRYGVDTRGRIIEQKDSARYKQIGNGVAACCTEWLGRRIMRVLQEGRY